MKLIQIVLFSSIFILQSLSAQTISRNVVASAGDHFISLNSQLEWTLGEVSIETFTSSASQLTQGFHQTNLIISTVQVGREIPGIEIFPNPVTSVVNIRNLGEQSKTLEVSLYNVEGKLLQTKSLAGGMEVHTLSMNEYAAGIFFLRVKSSDQVELKNYKIYKIR